MDEGSDYVKKVNRLIPQAENHADQQVKKRDFEKNDKLYAFSWDHAYFRKMDELAASAGLRSRRIMRSVKDCWLERQLHGEIRKTG